jgi:hypothetical protein
MLAHSTDCFAVQTATILRRLTGLGILFSFVLQHQGECKCSTVVVDKLNSVVTATFFGWPLLSFLN